MVKSCVYFGSVMHMRLKPKRHYFRYKVFSLFLDIDKLAEMDLHELEEYFKSLINSGERREVPTTRPVPQVPPPYDGPTREIEPMPPVPPEDDERQ